MSAKIFKKTVNKVVNENVRSGVLKRRIDLGAGSGAGSGSGSGAGSGAEAAHNVRITMVDQSTVSFFVEATLSRDALTEQNIQGSRISSVVIGNSVAHIAPATFYGCYALQNIEFQENSTLQTIGMRAFESTQLTSFSVVSTVKSIGEFAFSNISTLASIDVKDGNSVYSSKHGILYSKDGGVLLKYPEGRIQDIIDLSEEDVIEVGVGALERLSFVSSLYLPRKLEVIRGRALADYSYANVEQNLTTLNIPSSVELTTLIIPSTVEFIEPGTFDNMQLSALVVPPASLAYSVNSFINCSVENIFLFIPPSIWLKCIIGTNNTIEIKQPVEPATIEDIVSSGITILELEKYGYINSERISTAINVNTQLYGKYLNSYWVEAGQANNYHYITLRSNYADSSLGQVPTLDLVRFDGLRSTVVGTLSYRSKERYAVQSPIYPSWTTSIISNVDDAITITYVGDEILMKVDKFPTVQLPDGIYYMQGSMWSIDNTVLKNISSNESYTYNATTENYESLSNDRTWRALVGYTSKKTYYMEDENSSLFLYYNTSFLQSVKSAGIYNDTPDVDVVVRAANFDGFSIDLAQNAMMPASAPDGVGLAYMKVYNDFSYVAIVSLTNLIKYTLTFEVSAFNGLVDSCYAYIRTYNANKSENTIQKLPITDVGTYTATFLTQKSLIDNFSLEEIGIECFANTSADVHLTVSTCLLNVQIYQDNPADYYVGNSIILEKGSYFYTDENDAKVIFMAYEENGNNLLKLRTGIIYIYNSEYKAYINQDDDRLYFVFTEDSMTDAIGNAFAYDVATSSVILDLMFTSVLVVNELNSSIYVSNNLTLSDFLFYSSLISNATNLFSDFIILQTMINGIYKFTNTILGSNTEGLSTAQDFISSFSSYILLKSYENDSITYWNIVPPFTITLQENIEDINFDGFVGQYLLEVSAE